MRPDLHNLLTEESFALYHRALGQTAPSWHSISPEEREPWRVATREFYENALGQRATLAQMATWYVSLNPAVNAEAGRLGVGAVVRFLLDHLLYTEDTGTEPRVADVLEKLNPWLIKEQTHAMANAEGPRGPDRELAPRQPE